MNDIIGVVLCIIVVVFLVSVLAAMVVSVIQESHAWNVAEDMCYEGGYYFVERSDSRFYCVQHHNDGSKMLILVDTLVDNE